MAIFLFKIFVFTGEIFKGKSFDCKHFLISHTRSLIHVHHWFLSLHQGGGVLQRRKGQWFCVYIPPGGPLAHFVRLNRVPEYSAVLIFELSWTTSDTTWNNSIYVKSNTQNMSNCIPRPTEVREGKQSPWLLFCIFLNIDDNSSDNYQVNKVKIQQLQL